jgi:hypothetical protein
MVKRAASGSKAGFVMAISWLIDNFGLLTGGEIKQNF